MIGEFKMGMFDRKKVFEILKEHVKQPHLLKHCISVEVSMRAYAEKFNEDSEYWGAVGLLHDVDFEKYPTDHPNHTKELLSPYGYDDEFVQNIESHCRGNQEERRTNLQKVLVGVDEIPGFILACALVRPDKSLDNLEVRTVKKKMKDKKIKNISSSILCEKVGFYSEEKGEKILVNTIVYNELSRQAHGVNARDSLKVIGGVQKFRNYDCLQNGLWQLSLIEEMKFLIIIYCYCMFEEKLGKISDETYSRLYKLKMDLDLLSKDLKALYIF